MNHSIATADRATHLKIVVVALVSATLVAGVGITARITDSDTASRTAVVKAGAPVTVSHSDTILVR